MKSRWRNALLLVALFAATAGSYAVTARLPGPVVDRMLESDTERHAMSWLARVLDGLENGRSSFRGGEITDEDARFLELMVATSDIYRLKLFTAEGEVFWSSRNTDIGSVNTKPYFAASVARGVVFYSKAVRPPSEIDGYDLHDVQTRDVVERHTAEIYTPVIGEDGFLGAIEFYTDLTDARESFITRFRTILAALSGVGLFVLLLTSGIISRSGNRAMAHMSAQADVERKMMDDQLRLTREVKLLGELNEWLQSAATLEELFDMVSTFLSHMLPGSEGSMYVYSNSRDVLDGLAAWNGAEAREHIRAEDCWGLRRGRSYAYTPNELGFACGHADADDRSYFCFPVLAHGETVGLMHIRARAETSTEDFLSIQRLAQMCAEQISMAIANVRMRDQLQEQSIRDPLTGLFNRRHMSDSLRRLIQRMQRSGAGMSIVAVDVDHFKKFNDHHGHDAGDMVLRSVGTTLEKFCDGDEIACRMGGEEFMVILPEVDPETAAMRAEVLRRSIEEIQVRYGEKALPSVSVSIGVSHYPVHGMMPQKLIRAADEALYQAKAMGRNRVIVASIYDGDGKASSDAADEENPVDQVGLDELGLYRPVKTEDGDGMPPRRKDGPSKNGAGPCAAN